MSAADLVREAALEDSTAAVETWGPEAFARRTRAAIHGYRVPRSFDGRSKPVAGVNILLLGPTGAGKSSLIYTWFRALSGGVAQREDFFENQVHRSLLERLSVGWTGEDASRVEGDGGGAGGGAGASGSRGAGALAAAPRHGTAAFDAYELQAPTEEGGTGGICVHDSKGQQFFTPEEERFAEQLLQGKLRPGSSVDHRNFRYWFMLGQFGFFNTANLHTSPHVLVIVFDVTLRSFENMLSEGPGNELSTCYRRILLRAHQQGHEVFAALTHVDMYRCDGDSDDDDGGDGGDGGADAKDGGGVGGGGGGSRGKKSFDRERDMPALLSRWKTRLSAALADGRQPGVAPDRVFPVENYRKERPGHDAVLELAALEFLDATVHAGCRYIRRRCSQQQGCVVT